MVSALNRKLLRDINRLWGQVLTTSLVVAAGISGFIAMQSAYQSLQGAMRDYYETHRFADVFALTKRAPRDLQLQLETIDGVASVQTRIVERVRIDLDTQQAAVSARIISLPRNIASPLNRVFIKEGKMPEAHSRELQALLLVQFADYHQIRPGDALPVVLNGSIRQIRITGLAMSPEYVLAGSNDLATIGPGKFAVLWMPDTVLASSLSMAGAFNDAVFDLQPGANKSEVIDTIERYLEPYASLAVFDRSEQLSNRFLTEELESLKATVTVVPLVFLSVAAFLVNVVLSRLVELQRGQIATLKAIGYSNFTIAFHYLLLACLIVFLGSVPGLAAGAWLGEKLLGIYGGFYSFPFLELRFDPATVGLSIGISFTAAAAGALAATTRTFRLPPAEAMRPPAPAHYRHSLVDRISRSLIGPLGQMIFREIRRRPLRTATSSLGIAFAVAIMVIGRASTDSMDRLLTLQYQQAQKEDLNVSFAGPLDRAVVRSLQALPGVHHVESLRAIPVRLQSGFVSHDGSINGLPRSGTLRAIIDINGRTHRLAAGGVTLSTVLADKLHVTTGDQLDVRLLEGERRRHTVTVAGVVDDMIGMQGYMLYDELTALAGGDPVMTSALLAADSNQQARTALYALPAVVSVSSPAEAERNFRQEQAGPMLAMSFILAFLASIIAIGIVYNNVRVTLSMRSHELASMRVLGYTRPEISFLLFGELTIHILLALPPGMWLGTRGASAIMSSASDLYRMPMDVSVATYAYAAAVTAAAGIVSALLARKKLIGLDLIAVLKMST